mgnify:CR=1 FL=1
MFACMRRSIEASGRRKTLADIKLMKEDPAGVEKMTEEITTRYARLFRAVTIPRRGE